MAELLTRLLKKDVLFNYSPEQKKAFEGLKKLTTKVLILAFFVSRYPTKVETDTFYNITGRVI